MSYILTYVRGALATTDLESIFLILEIPSTDAIHMEDRNHWDFPEQIGPNFEGQSFLVLTNYNSRVWPVNHLYHH